MVSIAIPASCVDSQTCSNLEQATYTLYQISRACVMFNVEEIVVYDPVFEKPEVNSEPAPKKIKLDEEPSEKPAAPAKEVSESLKFTANLLQYFITPKHLRTQLFKAIGNLQQFKFAKRFPPIPYAHMDSDIIQGIAVPKERIKKLPGQKKLTKKNRKDATLTPYINLGFSNLFELETPVQVNSQVLVNIKTKSVVEDDKSNKYTVRAVTNFSHVFTECPIGDGYNQTLYVPSQQFMTDKLPLIQETSLKSDLKATLLVFGKWNEVQSSVLNDPEIEIDDASGIFDGMVTIKPKARMEDSVTAALARI